MDGSLALYGGSFNPIHIGHLIVARAVGEHLQISRLILIPCATPPHKRIDQLADAAERLEMVRQAVADEPLFEVSDIELNRRGPSYTLLTVEAFRESIGPDTPLYWIIGADTLPELHTWYRVEELVEACSMITVARPGYAEPDLAPLSKLLTSAQIQRLRDNILTTPWIDVSATDIRKRLREGRSIRYLVPDEVHSYIDTNGLYRKP